MDNVLDYDLKLDCTCEEFIGVCRKIIKDHPEAQVMNAAEPKKLRIGFVFFWKGLNKHPHDGVAYTCFPTVSIMSLDQNKPLDFLFSKFIETLEGQEKLRIWLFGK
jgi:hypothetical protein